MNDLGYVADIDKPRSKEELSVIAKGKNGCAASPESVESSHI
jgi:hypothetical protein